MPDFLFVLVFIVIATSICVVLAASLSKSPNSTVRPTESILRMNRRQPHRHLDNINGTGNPIVHEDPEPGYVVLNGIKRRISDCKYL